MNRPSTDLFDLVHALDAQEVRACRTAMRESGSQSRQIFDLVLRQSQYDEAAVREAIGRPVSANQFSVAKNYLYHFVLGTLLERRLSARTEGEAWHRLKLLDILYDKELYDQCWKVLRSAERVLGDLDHPGLMQEALRWHHRLYERSYHQVDIATFRSLNERFLSNSHALEEYNAYQYLHQEFMFRLRNRGVLRGESGMRDGLQDLFEDARLHAEAKPGSRAAALLYHFIRGMYGYMLGDFPAALSDFDRVVAEMKAQPAWQSLQQDLFFEVLYWKGNTCIQLGKFEDTRQTLREMERLRADSGFDRARLFYYRADLHRSYVSIFGTVEEITRNAEEIMREMPLHAARCRSEERMTLYFNAGLSLLIAGKPARSAHCIHHVIQAPELKQYAEIEVASKILLVMIYLELDDMGLYRHYRRSLLRRLRNDPERFVLERVMLEGVGQIARARKPEARKELWAALAERMLAAETDNKRSISYFGFSIWCRSRAQGEPFINLYRDWIAVQMEAGEAGKQEQNAGG